MTGWRRCSPPVDGEVVLVAERPAAEAGARARRPWPAYGALAILTVALGLTIGPAGVLAGLATAAAWYALGVPYALAAGHVILVAGTPGLELPTIVLVELAFLVLLVASVGRTPAPRVAGVVVLVAGLGLGALAGATLLAQELWVAAVVLVGTIALVAYAVHRYELVRLGLVTEADDSHATPTRNEP